MNREDAGEIMQMVIAAWPSPQVEPETIVVYVQAMLDLPRDATRHVVQTLILNERFRPSVSTIRLSVARSLGLLPPDEGVALEQATRYMRYKGQMRYANGSGYLPTEPPVSPAVKAACGPIPVEDDRWEFTFRRLYPHQVEVSTREALASGMTDRVRAIGSGA